MNLEPLREALLDAASRDAKEQARSEDETARVRLAAARQQAAELVEHGRLAGEQAAAREAARARADAARRARESRLHAERALVDELRARARDAVLEFRGDPRYGALLDRLGETARSRLGPEVELERDPAGSGGLIARAGRRSIDYSLPALVDRAIDDLGGGLEELWR